MNHTADSPDRESIFDTPEALPRVLVTSVTTWAGSDGADTYSALFEGYPSHLLASLYIREEHPVSTVPGRHFRISESQVISSVLRRRTSTGREVSPNCHECEADLAAIDQTRARYLKRTGRRRWLLLLVRELIWLFGRWRTPELDRFLDDFRPEVVLFGMEGYIHLNRISRYVVRHTGARAVGYFLDDNFTYLQYPRSIGYRLYRFFQRRELRKCVQLGDYFYAISPKTKAECEAYFGIKCNLLTKPATVHPAKVTYEAGRAIQLLYTGNLAHGRFDTIKQLDASISALNEAGHSLHLDVYTTTRLSGAEMASLTPWTKVHEPIPQCAVRDEQRRADILVFAEDLSGSERHVARLSFSTKLTDYLGSGRCILAVAPSDIAPMEYLRAEDAALCASNAREITECLMGVVNDPSLMQEYAQKAVQCAQRNHRLDDIRWRLLRGLGGSRNADGSDAAPRVAP